MRTGRKIARTASVVTSAIVGGLLLAGSAQASHEKVLYSFAGGSDGANPYAGLTMDAAGNLYGLTENGGASDGGTAFKLAPDGTESILHAFGSGSDGVLPYGTPILDAAANLYGTTVLGGASGNGTVFRIAPDGTETVLYSFGGGSDGSQPLGSLFMDEAGNLYGTTTFGGTSDLGTIFKLSPGGSETVLHAFDGSDGAEPFSGMVRDAGGNFYGTTTFGGRGCRHGGCGVVFKLTADGTYSVLHDFSGLSDGDQPTELLLDGTGAIFGETYAGGAADRGVVFKLAPDGSETLLHSFIGGADGQNPESGPISDGAGNLFGVTFKGGPRNSGTVFKLAPDGTETVLYAFGRKHGKNPRAALIIDAHGKLYGTTYLGGVGRLGTVFRIGD